MAFTDLHVISEMFDGLSGCLDYGATRRNSASGPAENTQNADGLTVDFFKAQPESTEKYKLQTVSSRLTKQQRRDASRAEFSAGHERLRRVRVR